MIRLNSLQKSKLKTLYREYWLYRMIVVPSKEIEQILSRVRLSPEEVFLECLTQLEKALDNPDAYKMEARMLWDDYYCEFRDSSPSDTTVGELGLAATEICFVMSFIFNSIETRLTVKTIMPKIVKKMIEHEELYDKVEQSFKKTLPFPETDRCIQELQTYVAEGKKLSQTILDQLEDWGEGKIKSGEIEFIESSGDIYSNRQVVILFQELLNISLSSEDTNITELARYIHKVTGRNIETIRTYIKRLNKVDEYPNKDINRITKDLEQISPELAKAIRARFD